MWIFLKLDIIKQNLLFFLILILLDEIFFI